MKILILLLQSNISSALHSLNSFEWELFPIESIFKEHSIFVSGWKLVLILMLQVFFSYSCFWCLLLNGSLEPNAKKALKNKEEIRNFSWHIRRVLANLFYISWSFNYIERRKLAIVIIRDLSFGFLLIFFLCLVLKRT